MSVNNVNCTIFHFRAQQLLLVRLRKMALEQKDFKKKVVRLLVLKWHEQQAQFQSLRLSKLLHNLVTTINATVRFESFLLFSCSSWRKHLGVYDWLRQQTPVAVGSVPHSRSFTHSTNVRCCRSLTGMQHQICMIKLCTLHECVCSFMCACALRSRGALDPVQCGAAGAGSD